MKLIIYLIIFIASFKIHAGVVCANANYDIDKENLSHILNKSQEFIKDKPNARSNLKTQGLLYGEGIREQSIEARSDFQKAEFLAFSWRITKDPIYLNKTKQILLAWAKIYKPSFNPIDETKFSDLFKAYILIKDDLNLDDQNKIKTWISSFSQGYLIELINNSNKENPQFTNWQSHRIKLALFSAISIDDKNAINMILNFYREQVYKNISNSGEVYDFTTRDSIGYSVYSLTPLIETLLLINDNYPSWIKKNEDVKNRILLGVSWLKPYILKNKIHKEFNNSKIQFDHIRYDKIINNNTNNWNPKNSANLIWMSTYFDNNNLSLAKQLYKKEPSLIKLCYGNQ
ncbi:alginate lyase family protein [uncultured Acinetobacter sp.]|uniref:alginate lyase family protein n=1 Tax=uncultured Acinetobacter sp. TaxID=165433 RepID=UPI0025853466|nr:alginate lyase family protein [uncultured Acinetobacter sp.]